MLGWNTGGYGRDDTPMEAWTAPVQPLFAALRGGEALTIEVNSQWTGLPAAQLPTGQADQSNVTSIQEMVAAAAQGDDTDAWAAEYLTYLITNGAAMVSVANIANMGPDRRLGTDWEELGQWQEAAHYT